jgi:hypothetical protein
MHREQAGAPNRRDRFEERAALLDQLGNRRNGLDQVGVAPPLTLDNFGAHRLDVDEMVVYGAGRHPGPRRDIRHGWLQVARLVAREQCIDDRLAITGAAFDPAVDGGHGGQSGTSCKSPATICCDRRHIVEEGYAGVPWRT